MKETFESALVLCEINNSVIQELTSDNSVVLDGTSDDHDSVVERALSFFHELLGTTTDEDCARLGLGTSSEEVESVVKKMSFIKPPFDVNHQSG